MGASYVTFWFKKCLAQKGAELFIVRALHYPYRYAVWTLCALFAHFRNQMSFTTPFRRWGEVALVALLLAGCSRQNDPKAGLPGKPLVASALANSFPMQGDWVVQRIDSDVDTLNPIVTQTTNGQAISYPLISEGMLRVNNYTLKLEPCLAQSWDDFTR